MPLEEKELEKPPRFKKLDAFREGAYRNHQISSYRTTNIYMNNYVKSKFTLTVQMKNWLPLVFGPAFAMLTIPGPK